MALGALTPIVLTKKMFDSCVQERTPLAEVATWGASIVFNAIPFAAGLPIAIYGMIIGGVAGTLSAQQLRRGRIKRERESELVEITAA